MAGCAKRCKQGLVKFAVSLHRLVTGTLTTVKQSRAGSSFLPRCVHKSVNMGLAVGTFSMQSKQVNYRKGYPLHGCSLKRWAAVEPWNAASRYEKNGSW
ncbi:hypothetical protein NHX12_010781 [Muraenolepis orangiensis]|uniref:Uncharacterized protein n=1 Tax=Muraenolepis orangiensis TaxID=630683 RepID=A0A9Q0DEV9_9TELE|nr:hypothetical protein NHX12_010781 [Muraenolepis orangiensis]